MEVTIEVIAAELNQLPQHDLVSPTGGKGWRFKYRFEGTHETLSMGVYPDVGLKEARPIACESAVTDRVRKIVARQCAAFARPNT